MEEQDKYYVPKIEEFHVGFEYESLSDPRIPEKDSSWDKYTIDNVNNFQNFLLLYEKYDAMEVRVKYLDREDIESLGFVCKEFLTIFKDTNNFSYCFILNNIKLSWFNVEETQTISIFVYENIIEDWKLKYNGTIKNKSELKFILKSIGVLEENKI